MTKSRSFEALREDGSPCILFVHSRFIQARIGPANPGSRLVEVKSFRTADGKNVRRLRKGLYLCEGTGEMLTSDNPDAE